MAISFRIHDLTAFSLIPEGERNIKRGDVYIDSSALCAAAAINGKLVVVRLSGSSTPTILEDRASYSRRALVLSASFRLVVRPIGESEPIDTNNIAGWLLPGAGPSLGCLFGNDRFDEPDRVAFDLRAADSMGVYFHERRFQFGWPTWEIDWVNDHGEPVLTLTRTA